MLAALLVLSACFIVPLPRLGSFTALRGLSKRLSKNQSDREEQELNWAAAMVGELRAGKQPVLALVDCHKDHPVAPHAVRASRLGARVTDALKRDAGHPRSLLYSVAAIWDVAHSSGTSLADILQKITEGQRQTLEVRRALHVELAGPRTTARMMSALPLLGLLLGVLLGANPLGWLISSSGGLAVMVGGLALNIAGYRWIQKVVSRVEESL